MPPKVDAGTNLSAMRRSAAARRFDDHHSAEDKVTVVDRGQLNQNVAAWACLVYLVADSELDFRGPPAK